MLKSHIILFAFKPVRDEDFKVVASSVVTVTPRASVRGHPRTTGCSRKAVNETILIESIMFRTIAVFPIVQATVPAIIEKSSVPRVVLDALVNL